MCSLILVDKVNSVYMYSFLATIRKKYCISMLSLYKKIRIIYSIGFKNLYKINKETKAIERWEGIIHEPRRNGR